MGKRGRKKRVLQSKLPPEFSKLPVEVWPLLQAGFFGKPGLFGTYALILALSWGTGVCDWTNEALAEAMGVSTREIKWHVAELKRRGLLESHVASSKADGSSAGGRLLVPASPQKLLSLAAEAQVRGSPGIRGKKTSPSEGKKTSPKFNYGEENFPPIPRVEDNTRVGSKTGGGGSMSIPDLDLRNNNNAREEISPPPTLDPWEAGGPGGEGGKAGKKTSPKFNYGEENLPQIPRVEDYTRAGSKTGGGGSMPIQGLDSKNNNDNAREEIAPPPNLGSWEEGGPGGEGRKTGKKTSPKFNYGEENFPQINPAFETLAGIIGLTTPTSVALMARIASEHHVGPRRLLALWRNVQKSGGGQGAFVHRLRNGFEPKLLPEPDHETPGFCPVCGAEISMHYGFGGCPNGHELRVCDVCGELAPVDGPCPWCGAEPEAEHEDKESEFQGVNA